MKQFFNHIKMKYDMETCITLKNYSKQNNKLVKQKEKLKYLLQCREYGILPKHLINTTSKMKTGFTSDKVKKQLEKIEHIFLFKVLNLEIRQAYTSITSIKKIIFHTSIKMKELLSNNEYNTYILKQKHMYNYIATQIQATHSQKIEKLKDKELQSIGFVLNENWFVNTTSIPFPTEVRWLLSLGKKFALPVSKRNFSSIHVIADVEQAIQKIRDDTEKDIARCKIANKISEHKRRLKNSTKEKFILKIYQKTHTFLKQHKNEIVLTTADKGSKTVIMYKEDYNRKMNILLEDKNTYKTTRTDPTIELQKTNNQIVTELFKQDIIDKWQKNKLRCSAAIAPKLYGLPKVHKKDLPLRPIASSINVPCYQLSKFIGKTLQNMVSDKYNIKNSLELKEKLKDVVLEDNDIFVSFDVISLFTNIPTYLAIKIILKKWDKLQDQTKIPKRQILKLLEFCIRENNYFEFNNTFYNQTFGMPMGNPLSPTIADIVLDDLLDNVFEELKKESIEIKFITKYVDDIFAIIQRKDEHKILQKLNEYHTKIQFTTEREKNNQLPFLDILLIRENNKIAFNWYSKPTSSGRLINFLSTQPLSQKINTARNLINKTLELSDKCYHEENTQKIVSILKMNSFPRYIIDNLLKNKKQKINPKIRLNADGNPKIFTKVPFIPNLTESKNLFKIIKEENNITFAHKSNETLSKLFTNTKTPIPKDNTYDVIYEIGCKGKQGESCNLVYIGTTKRTLGIRMTEHKRDIKNRRETTGISQHMLNTAHEPDFDNVKIVDKERNRGTRYTLESLRIQQKRTTSMNLKEDIDGTKSIYDIAIL